MKKFVLAGVALTALAAPNPAVAADRPVKAPPPPVWDWTGSYIGVHFGGSAGRTTFSDPFGAPIFGDVVRTPGFFAGGQVGYNWQAPGSNFVWGVEADVSGFDSEGTNTCFAFSASAINSTCRVRPTVAGTLTGRVGAAVGPGGHTFVYAKGGGAALNSTVDQAINNAPVGIVGPPIL